MCFTPRGDIIIIIIIPRRVDVDVATHRDASVVPFASPSVFAALVIAARRECRDGC